MLKFYYCLIKVVLLYHIFIIGLCMCFTAWVIPLQIPFPNISGKPVSWSSSSLNLLRHSSQMEPWTDTDHRETSTILLSQKWSWLWHVHSWSTQTFCLLLTLCKNHSNSSCKSELFFYRLHSKTWTALASF